MVGHERSPRVTREQQQKIAEQRAYDQGKASVQFSVASCTVISTHPTICPLCRAKVAGGQVHTCSIKETP